MQSTGTHVDSIGIGDNVWVKQGKTDHMAIFCGNPRSIVMYPASDESSDEGTEVIEVLIKWASTGGKSHVEISSVRPMIEGSRRRRQVVNHFQAAPSKRPITRKKRIKAKLKGPTPKIPLSSAISDEHTGNNDAEIKVGQKRKRESAMEDRKKEEPQPVAPEERRQSDSNNDDVKKFGKKRKIKDPREERKQENPKPTAPEELRQRASNNDDENKISKKKKTKKDTREEPKIGNMMPAGSEEQKQQASNDDDGSKISKKTKAKKDTREEPKGGNMMPSGSEEQKQRASNDDDESKISKKKKKKKDTSEKPKGGNMMLAGSEEQRRRASTDDDKRKISKKKKKRDPMEEPKGTNMVLEASEEQRRRASNDDDGSKISKKKKKRDLMKEPKGTNMVLKASEEQRRRASNDDDESKIRKKKKKRDPMEEPKGDNMVPAASEEQRRRASNDDDESEISKKKKHPRQESKQDNLKPSASEEQWRRAINYDIESKLNKKKKKDDPRDELRQEFLRQHASNNGDKNAVKTGEKSNIDENSRRQLPLSEEFQKQQYEKQPEKEKKEIKKVSKENPRQQLDPEQLRTSNNKNDGNRNAPKTPENQNLDENSRGQSGKKSPFKFKLPSKEEFQKYQESKRKKEKREKKEEIERENESIRKRKRQQFPERQRVINIDSDSDGVNVINSDRDDGNAAKTQEKLNSNNPKPAELPKSPSIDLGITNSTAKTTTQGCAMPQSTGSSPAKKKQSKRISDSDGQEESYYVQAEIEPVGVFKDPNHTIDQGFRWEWESPGSARHKSQNQISSAENNSSNKPVPENSGKRPPQSWDEAYAMMAEFRSSHPKNRCDIPSNHPLLGKFVTKLRLEYSKFRKHVREQSRPDAEIDNLGAMYRNADHESQLKDMTRVDCKRVKKLKKLGFKWQVSVDSETDTKDEEAFKKVSSGNDIRPSTTNSDNESSDESIVSSLGDSSDDDSVDDDGNDSDDSDFIMDAFGRAKRSNSKKKPSERLSTKSSSSSSSSSDGDRYLSNSQIDDHANDDSFLIAPSLKHITFVDSCSINMKIVKARKHTFPIELYRLLRLSILQPKLGIDKVIRWTNDGNGLHLLDESLFFQKILKKTSNMNKIISFRNALGQFNFTCIKNGVNERGGKYRIYRHQSIAEAEEANDPSLRQFYRGVPLDVMWTIKTRLEERAKGSENVTGGKCIYTSTRINEVRDSEIAKSLEIVRVPTPDPEVKRRIDMLSRARERVRRRTSDGGLLPKYGSEHLLLEDGTYDKPRGARPNGLIWDKFRGLWTPANRNVYSPPKKKPTEEIKAAKKVYENRRRFEGRRTSDGCLLPKNKPSLLDDGTYKRPMGHIPRNMMWDGIRGLWAPLGAKAISFGSDTNRATMPSSTDDDSMIIKASKANLFQHPSSILRSFFQPKSKKRRRQRHYHSKHFQARTKSNPSGIVHHTINLRNWRKIEKLMERSTRQKKKELCEPSAVTNNSFAADGEVRFI